MANPFAAAAAKAATPQPAGGKKVQNIIEVSDPDIAAAIDDFCKAHVVWTSAKTDKDVASGTATPFCRTEFFRAFAESGKKPSTMKFRTPNGNTVTLITQDRGEKYACSEEQLETLRAILGNRVEGIIIQDMTFSFNNGILNKPGVMEALGAKIADLTSDGILTASEAERLLEATPRTTIRKGVLDDLYGLCDGDPNQMEAVTAALGSHATSYIQS